MGVEGASIFCAASSFLGEMGYPASHNNLVSLVGWMQAEGSPCRNNPLDTTEDFAGATNCNSVGVKNYAWLDDGVKATADTLHLNAGGYSAIRSCLAAAADPLETGAAIEHSAWGTGALALECITDARNDPATFAAWGAKTIA